MVMENATNLSSSDINGFKAVGATHILLVSIPSLILGTIVLSLLLSNKKLRDPASIIFICNTILCVVSPITYGLLMDISLLTDIPVIGKCGTLRENTFWVFFYVSHLQLVTGTAFLSIAQYIAIRWGVRYLSTGKTVAIYTLLLGAGILLGIVNIIIPLFDRRFTVRGSLCESTLSISASAVINILNGSALVVFFVPSVVIVVIFSVLTYRYVNRHTIENKKVVRNIVTIMILITTSLVVFRLPVILDYLLVEESTNELTYFALAYTAEINFPIFILLIIAIHKTVREVFVQKLKKCISSCDFHQSSSNQVAPSTINTHYSSA